MQLRADRAWSLHQAGCQAPWRSDGFPFQAVRGMRHRPQNLGMQHCAAPLIVIRFKSAATAEQSRVGCNKTHQGTLFWHVPEEFWIASWQHSPFSAFFLLAVEHPFLSSVSWFCEAMMVKAGSTVGILPRTSSLGSGVAPRKAKERKEGRPGIE